MKIQYLSDLHLEFASMKLPVSEADVVVLAGDIHSDGRKAIDWASSFPQEVIYILGNHEFYTGGTIVDLPADLKTYAKKYPNIHVLNNDSIVLITWLSMVVHCGRTSSYMESRRWPSTMLKRA